MSVMPNSRASDTARLLGAETAHTIGTPAIRDFWRISKLLRPLTITMCRLSGRRPPSSAQPTTLSSALWRPTSSRTASRCPPGSDTAVEEPRRQLDVRARSAHGDRHRTLPGALAPSPEDGKGACVRRDAGRAQADLQGLLGRDLVRPGPGLPRLHDPDAGFALAVGTVAHGEPLSRLSFDKHERQAEMTPWLRARAVTRSSSTPTGPSGSR